MDKLELTQFNESFQSILSIVAANKFPQELEETYKRIKDIIIYNVPHGKKTRGLTVVSSYRLLADPKELTEENLELARILGWCVELLQAEFLILDDVMDQSSTRRGQICWYKREDVGLMALNDAIIIRSGMFQVLKHYFDNESYYGNILDIFTDTTRLTSYGQNMDLMSCPPGKRPDLNTFTMERYEAIVKYKTAFYTFVLPVRLAMILSKCFIEEDHQVAEKILLRIGFLFQMQDDFLDYFGDPKVIGKIGTDIEEGKCCWPIVTALQMSSPEKKLILKQNYGVKSPDAVTQIKNIYDSLGLTLIYKKQEKLIYEEICALIDKQLENRPNLNPHVFYNLLNKIYRRNK